MKFNAVKGVKDILPPEVYTWREIECRAKEVFGSFGFEELRLPVMEHTEVFTRSIGETTDIVEKEMYTFEDKGGRSITLRPEGTASAVRCFIENALYSRPMPQKYYYHGPMFRYERPQKGRLRQFYQIGVEAFGSPEPRMDAEIISMLFFFLKRIGLEGTTLEINSIGCGDCRPLYREALKDFFSSRLDNLCPDCKRRHNYNPLRILDCKVPSCIEQKTGAPPVTGFLCGACQEHYGRLKDFLGLLDISYAENPSLVRGLDYYTRTIFEVKSVSLGAQNAVSAGGRYDRLVEEFGGPATPAIGFAIGMERLTSLVKEASAPSPDAFIAVLGGEAEKEALRIAGGLRLKGLWVELGDSPASLKSQMRRADRLLAGHALIIGENELKNRKMTWKRLKSGESGEVGIEEVYTFLKKNI